MKRIFYILIILSAIVSLAYSQPMKCTVHLKNKSHLDLSIKSVREWGLITQDNTVINYRVIDYIWTMDTNLLDLVRSYVENLKIRAEKGGYLIHFSTAKFRRLKAYRRKSVVYISFTTLYSTEERNAFNSALNFSPLVSEPLVLRAGFSSASILNHEIRNFGYLYGAGLHFDFHRNHRIQSSLDYIVNSGEHLTDVWAFETNYQYVFSNFNHLILICGAKYILNNLTAGDNRKTLNFKFGLGINLLD